MKKRYSIHDNKNQTKKDKSQIDKVYRKTKGLKLYLGAIVSFFSIGLLIILSPMALGKDYDYQTVDLSEPQNVTSSLNMYIDDMEMNKETGLFKLVLRYEDDTKTKSLSNIKSEYKLNYITNKGKDTAKSKVVKLSDEYTVVYYEGLPKDFGVISVSISPRYVYPELEPSDDLKDKEIKFYAVDRDIKSNGKLEIESTSDLKKDNFKYQTKAIKSEIESEQDKIKKLELSNELVKKDIAKAEQELDFQTLEEQTDTKNEINSMKTTIENNKTLIEESNKKISGYKEKIDQIEKTASSFD